LRQIATANLTFEGANRSTGIRITSLALLLIVLDWISVITLRPTFISASLPPVPFETVFSFVCGLQVFVWLVGLFATTEDERLSRRVREEVPDSPLLRALTLLFYPGGGRGFLYFLVLLTSLETVSWFVMPRSSYGLMSGFADPVGQARTLLIIFSSYLLFYIGLTACLGRWLRRLGTDLHATHARVLGILLVAFGTIAPMMFLFVYESIYTHPWLMITNPFVISWIFMTPSMDSVVVQISSFSIPMPFFLGLLGVALNLTSMSNGIREYFTLPKRAPFVEAIE
jgi:hypothetical protein